jgi:hypothetical protein
VALVKSINGSWVKGVTLGAACVLGVAAGARPGSDVARAQQPAPAAATNGGAAVSSLQADADSLQSKLESIVRFGAIPRLETQSTVLHEREVNAYVWTYLMGDLPPGVTSPRVEMVGDSVLRGSVVLDMDAYRASRAPAQGLDPLSLLSGRLTARVRGRLLTGDGVGRFEIEQADLAGIPLPATLVQRLLSHYSRTPDQPDGIRIDEPFDLPVSIREIRVQPREAVVVQ